MLNHNYGLSEEAMSELEEFAERIIGKPLDKPIKYTSSTNIRVVAKQNEAKNRTQNDIESTQETQENCSITEPKTNSKIVQIGDRITNQGNEITETIKSNQNEPVKFHGRVERIRHYQENSNDPIVDFDYNPFKKKKIKRPSKLTHQKELLESKQTIESVTEVLPEPKQIIESVIEVLPQSNQTIKSVIEVNKPEEINLEQNQPVKFHGRVESIKHYQENSNDPIVDFDYNPSRQRKIRKPKVMTKKDFAKFYQTDSEERRKAKSQAKVEKNKLKAEKKAQKNQTKAQNKAEKKKRKEEKKLAIKRARGEAKRRNKRRSIWERISNMNEYSRGEYDYLEGLNDDEKKDEIWKDEIEQLEDAEKDYNSFMKKIIPFRLGIATIGLAFSYMAVDKLNISDNFNYLVNEVQNIGTPAPVEEPTTIVTQVPKARLGYEEEQAKGAFLETYDQEYLIERINENFIPENATQEDIIVVMQDAWESLEPEVQKWVREPAKVYESGLGQKEIQDLAQIVAEITTRKRNSQIELTQEYRTNDIEKGEDR